MTAIPGESTVPVIVQWYRSQLDAQAKRREQRANPGPIGTLLHESARFIASTEPNGAISWQPTVTGGPCYIGANWRKCKRLASMSTRDWVRVMQFMKAPEVKFGAGPKCSKEHQAAYLQRLDKDERRASRNAAKRERR